MWSFYISYAFMNSDAILYPSSFHWNVKLKIVIKTRQKVILPTQNESKKWNKQNKLSNFIITCYDFVGKRVFQNNWSQTDKFGIQNYSVLCLKEPRNIPVCLYRDICGLMFPVCVARKRSSEILKTDNILIIWLKPYQGKLPAA